MTAVSQAGRLASRSRRPASIVADIYVAAELGADRPLEIRETQKFFELRNKVLHLIRNETGVVV